MYAKEINKLKLEGQTLVSYAAVLVFRFDQYFAAVTKAVHNIHFLLFQDFRFFFFFTVVGLSPYFLLKPEIYPKERTSGKPLTGQSFSIALETLWNVTSLSEKEYNQMTSSATWSIMRYSEGVLILSNQRDETIIFPDNHTLSRDLLKGIISIKLLPAC